MSMSNLPKEIRLQIWTLAYFSQPPRLVAIETHQHDKSHSSDTFCPRYSPTPAPTVFNICQESRAEAHFQALKAGHVVRLPYAAGPGFFSDFYFRWDVDVLSVKTWGERIGHLDNNPQVGLLAHLREASAGTPTATALRNVDITTFTWGSYRNDCFSDFPNIARMIMMVDRRCLNGDALQKTKVVDAAKWVLTSYRLDLVMAAVKRGVQYKARPFALDFAMLGTEGELQVIPREEWREWSNAGDAWVTLDYHLEQ